MLYSVGYNSVPEVPKRGPLLLENAIWLSIYQHHGSPLLCKGRLFSLIEVADPSFTPRVHSLLRPFSNAMQYADLSSAWHPSCDPLFWVILPGAYRSAEPTRLHNVSYVTWGARCYFGHGQDMVDGESI